MAQQFVLIREFPALSSAFSDIIFHLLNLGLNRKVTSITRTNNHTQLIATGWIFV